MVVSKRFTVVDPNAMPPRRLVIRVGGFEKEGKTHFGLTAPAPIDVLNIDRGLEGVVEKFARVKEIRMSEDFRAMPSETQADNEKRWDAIMAAYRESLTSSTTRSILFDTDTEAWEIGRLAYLGKLVGVRELHYPEVNSIFRGVIDMALAHDKNVIFTCRMRKQYVKSKGSDGKDTNSWNGKYEESGFGEFGSIVQASLRACIVNEDGVNVPTVRVINCRQNMQMNGEVFEGDMATFSWVAANIIEGTSPEDWE